MKKKLLILSDGNGVDTDFKKWPFFLRLLLSKTHVTVNRSVIGASNEMLFMRLVETANDQHIDQAIIQWSIPRRIDVLVDDFWAEQALVDPVYYFNIVETFNRKWWVTSKSQNAHINQYHQQYIPRWHAHFRADATCLAAAEFCRQNGIDFVFSLCYDRKFTGPLSDTLMSYPWVWHSPGCGLSEFRYTSKYLSYDKDFSQPHPLIGLEWIDQVLKPQCGFIDYSEETRYNIEQALLQQCSK